MKETLERNSDPKEPETFIDTSKMNRGERAALEMTEAARDAASQRGSIAGSFFFGNPDLDRAAHFPGQTLEDRDQGDAFLSRLDQFLNDEVDADEIDATGEIPDEVIEGLAGMGAFGIKIPTRYGGLGLSQSNYARAAMRLGAVCGNLTALVSAHQSIGVPQPLIIFGTEEQKAKFLPRVAKGEISAFALTEPGVGSDPAKMKTSAVPTEDGKGFLLNGEKLWCTNGTRAGVIVVMAGTPPKTIRGRKRSQVSAFIVEMNSPGVSIAHRCRFMGLRSLYNAVVRFEDVLIPRENIILAEGKGLKVALTTLNTGRITLPAACTGLAKECVKASLGWSRGREQWGAAIGKHGAIADKLARMAADTFAMEAMTRFVAGLVDQSKKNDIRIEAAMAKLWATEKAWRIVDETMQIRGGRGYETASSLKARGDNPVPVERWMRDCRINTIFEGSSEIMRLFIAREALDPHLKIGGAALNTQLPIAKRLGAAVKAGLFYAGWYPQQWLPTISGSKGIDPKLRRHMKYVRRTSRRLSRRLFHAMVRFGPKLDKQQMLLGRFVDIGTELFAMTATISYASYLLKHGDGNPDDIISKTDYFCRKTRVEIDSLFRGIRGNTDKEGYRLAQRLLAES